MPHVSSSAVERVHYDPATARLDIWYKGGGLYSYFDVPADIYRAMLTAPSLGAFVNREIKPHYRCALEPRRRRFRPAD
ncbi:KTSC domain-containing protein [Sphingosinicella rhizophila]|uniref:KTSC domain-containing protein n=1 Tax=Sphingosinicella rhizophila TaxID=3050082 RepID=A0ABU3Q8E3_9SPHN|nr:KTSC domain-containing protein [Sphingosinicella sp. GR2756]MDT9599248.1 KTSC domain-containing protein [Sphingosinicella sp. GR2756]